MIRSLIASACVLLASCSTMQDLKQGVAMTQSAVDEFHHRLKAQEDARIFSEATTEYQRSMGAEASHAFLTKIRRKLGMPGSSQPVNIQVKHMPGGTFVVAQYRTHFENGDAQENFTWQVQDGKPRLLGYFVSSPLLLTD